MIRVFTAFSGYDSQCLALDRLGVGYDLVGWSEIDKYAIQAHNLLFPQFAGRNFGDICAIDWAAVPDFDLFTYSFPCTNISDAGLREGLAEGSGTKSSLLWECRKAIIAKRPKYLVMENVKALVNKKNRPCFLKWQAELASYGYTNFAQVMNAKHYGVAQNRERVFMVSIIGDAWFDFPQKQRLTKCLADYLEPEVAEKYYLSEKMLAGFKLHAERHNERGNGFAFKPSNPDKPARTIQTTNGSRNTDNYIKEHPEIIQRGRGKNKGGSFDTCPTISANAWEQNSVVSKADRIRRLTPRECFRLMDVLDSDFDKLQAGISDTQLYKLAGNSIVEACLIAIFDNLLNQSDMRIYIAGKVSGLPYAEVEAKFERAKQRLLGWGYEPISPLDNDCASRCWAEQMMACLPLLMACGGIYLLDDWELSEGAKIEHTFALKRQMQIIHQ